MTDAPENDGGLRARRRALTERDIEDAALAAFESDGFESTPMDTIAARAGVSVRTAFRYFPAKVDTALFSARRVQLALTAGLRSDIHLSTSLVTLENSIAESLAALVESDPVVVARLKRLRALMLSDDRLRAEVAKSEGYLAGIEAGDPRAGGDNLQSRLVLEIVAATLRSAFDTWASTEGDGTALIAVYAQAREVRATLLG
jgi:AcrR family transcriptional regulator